MTKTKWQVSVWTNSKEVEPCAGDFILLAACFRGGVHSFQVLWKVFTTMTSAWHLISKGSTSLSLVYASITHLCRVKTNCVTRAQSRNTGTKDSLFPCSLLQHGQPEGIWNGYFSLEEHKSFPCVNASRSAKHKKKEKKFDPCACPCAYAYVEAVFTVK